jgi:hypothetical protein
MLKPCLERGCPRPTSRTRCPTHERQHDRARGTRQQRGYDAAHDQLRGLLVATYDPAEACSRCLRPLGPVAALLDLGHTDDRAGWQGLQHQACNRSGSASLFTGVSE